MELARSALKAARITNPVIEMGGGREALEWLRDRARDNELPAAVFLDLRMPEINGLEALRQIRADPDPNLRTLPVVMLSASHALDDIQSSFANGANSYVVKPTELAAFMSDVGLMGMYWTQRHHRPVL